MIKIYFDRRLIKMLFDMHVHSEYSFDAYDSVDAICAAAVEKGLNSIAITDHCDIDCEIAGLYEKLDKEAVRQDIMSAKEKYKGKLDIAYGIELGEPYLVPEKASEVIKQYGFDVVLCSVHNLENVPDFFFLDYSCMPKALIESLLERYFVDLERSASFPGVHIITHTSYPMRYLHKYGIDVDVMNYADSYKRLFKKIIENGLTLEYNLSGIRKGYVPSPTNELIKLYRECGGELICCGSDAHFAKDVGADIADAHKFLSDAGFRYVTAYKDGKLSQIKL